MKKLILLILLIPSILFAGPLQQMHKKVIAGQTVAGEGTPTNLGDENLYSSGWAPGNGTRTGFKLPVTTETGTLTSITVGISCEVDNTGKKARYSLYTHDDINNMPDELVATSAEVTSPAVNGTVAWKEGSISGSPSLSDATQYWVVVEFDDNYGGIGRGTYGATEKVIFAQQTGITAYDWTDWGGSSSSTNSNYPFSVYITYE